MMTTTAVMERLDARTVVTANGCHQWTGAKSSQGYGSICVDGVTRQTHVLAYEKAHGPVPDGHEVDHTCHNEDLTCPGGVTCLHRLCCNPAHLEAVTHTENVNRAGHGRETHCIRGHALIGPNLITKLRGRRSPVRNCRTCRDDRDFGRPR